MDSGRCVCPGNSVVRETAPRARRLARSDGTLAKRSRTASPVPSLSDEGTDTGEPARERKLRPRRTIPESDDELEPTPMGPVAGSDDAECASLRGRSTASALEVFKDGVRVDAANKCDKKKKKKQVRLTWCRRLRGAVI